MFIFLLFAVLCASCLAEPHLEHYSYSHGVGLGSGTSFVSEGEGRITAVRVWENYGSYITGFQLRFGPIWAARVGRQVGQPQELVLWKGEAIVQVSGKYSNSNYIYQVFFVTSSGRFLMAGQPSQGSFNFYPRHKGAELRMLSGRTNSAGITELGAHWAVVYIDEDKNKEDKHDEADL